MRIFVTGGAGFIGSVFVRQRLQEDTSQEITVFDSLTYAASLARLAAMESSPRYQFIKGDICDPSALTEAMEGHDVVVHFAAESHVDRSIADPSSFVRTNCYGTNMVMQAARQLGIERVIHISTDEVYGSIEKGSFEESDPLAPSSPYSASKAGSDLIALSYHRTYGLPVVIVRSSNNYGPFQSPDKIIPLFITNLLEDKTVPLYGDGRNVREWLYVDDNCDAIDVIMRKGAEGEIYNVGTGEEASNLELTERLLSLTGADSQKIEMVADRPGHDRRYALNSEKVKALGWQPKVDLAGGLAATVDWFRSNQPWWQPLKQTPSGDS